MEIRGAIGTLASLTDDQLRRRVAVGHGQRAAVQFHLYSALRSEQRSAANAATKGRPEVAAVLAQAQAAFRELEAFLLGRDDTVLDSVRDGEWSLRDLLRHLIAVELRYAAQVVYSAERGDADPIRIPEERLPCDRLSPPEDEFGATRSGGLAATLALFERARARSDERLKLLSSGVLERPSEKMLAPGAPFEEPRAIVRRIWRVRGLHERRTSQPEIARLDADLIALATAALLEVSPGSAA